MASSPTTCKVPRTTNFFSHHLSNCKQEIRYPKLFLSDNDDSVVLPDHLRRVPQIDVIPPTLRGSRCALFSVVHQHSACRYISSFHLLYLAYSIKGTDNTSLLKTQLHLRRIHRQPHSSASGNQRLASTPQQYLYRAADCA